MSPTPSPRAFLALIDPQDPLGFRFADPDEVQLSVLDLAATRGDGVFETFGVRSGHPQALDPHLARFARSAASLDLAAPSEAWRAAIIALAGKLSSVPFSVIKIVLSRGIEGAERPSGWLYGRPAPDHSAAQIDGIDVVILDRGYRHDVATTAPWLLQGAKTLSYAVNMAVLREAARRGADDVIFSSSDGFLLEAPTSSILVRRGDRFITPDLGLPILAGTTQASAFEFIESLGFEATYERFGVLELAHADGIWLLSSVRLAAPVRTLDGRPLAIDAAFTASLVGHLSGRRT